jgi:hypothetical protein
VDGRLFVKEGSLFLETDKGAHYCYVFLFNDLLLLTRQSRKRFKFRSMYPTHAIKNVHDIPDGGTYGRLYVSASEPQLTVVVVVVRVVVVVVVGPRSTSSLCSFTIALDNGITFTFLASTLTDKQAWLAALRNPSGIE